MAKDLIFKKDKAFPGAGSINLSAQAPKNTALGIAIATDAPFPAGTTDLGGINLSADGGSDVAFGKGKAKVSFGGEAFADIGVYLDSAKALAAVKLDDRLTVAMPTKPGDHQYVMLRAGYAVTAGASGSIALGAGVVPTFEVDASRNAAFAVLRLLPKSTGARTSIQDTLDSWTLPKKVSKDSDLDPGTWILAEVNGSVGVKLGAQYGYDFNWVRQAELGGLSGDIGLRIQLGVSATLGFNASGTYAVVVSRDSLAASDRKLRLRLFKLDSKGWSFALNAGATVTGDTSALTQGKNFDQFISAVLGLDGSQLMADLQKLETWSGTATDLPARLSELGADKAMALIQDIAGPELATFVQARNQVSGLLKKWDNLDHVVATKIWSFVGHEEELAKIKAIAAKIAGANDTSVRKLLSDRLSEVEFLDKSPEGQWLEAVLGDRMLKALTNNKELQQLQSAATSTLAILDGSKLEETLGRLHDRIGKKLGIDKIEEVVDKASLENMDAWLKAKLARFLGKQEALEVAQDDIVQIKKTIQLLREKRAEFYDKAVTALNKSYQFSFAAGYQSNRADTALLDVTFDFGAGKVSEMSAAFASAVDGDFDTLLVNQVKGVSLGEATLSHGITRQGTVAIDMPFFQKDVKKLNSSLAKVSAVEDDGRILLYNLDSSSVVEESVGAKVKRNSRLAIGGDVAVRLAKEGKPSLLVAHQSDGLTYDYSFHQAETALKRPGLEFRLKPYADAYFPDHFPPEASFSDWLSNLDHTISAQNAAAPGVFGNTLLSLEVSLPAGVTKAWLNAPSNSSAPEYRAMSLRIQAALKRTLVFYYFQNPRKYKNPLTLAQTLLAWASIPPSTSLPGHAKGLTWDWNDPAQRSSMVRSDEATRNLGRMLGEITGRLEAEPGFSKGKRSHFKPTQIAENNIASAALERPGLAFFISLLIVESSVIAAARDAGLAMAKFKDTMTTKPTEAIEALASFGSSITNAFNAELETNFDKGALRPLGSQLFVEAALAFDPTLTGQGAALAELVVMKGSAEFPPAGFPNHETPAEKDVVVAQRLVNDRLKLR